MTLTPSPAFDALNWLKETANATCLDLSQPMQNGIPIHPAHP